MTVSDPPGNDNVLTSETAATLQVEDLVHHAGTPRRPSAVAALEKTIFYLAYGSNLSSATFKGSRSLHPLSSVPVRVPTLQLTFDLPGIAYLEPCFANVRFTSPENDETARLLTPVQPPALFGVVYELTPADYAKLVSTEGGGAGYGDEIVDCYPLAPDAGVLRAHTLLAPQDRTRQTGAQPSLRYLEIIRAGAREHGLPVEWTEYLDALQEYRTTSVRQILGKAAWATIWTPILLLVIGLSSAFKGADGRSPDWLVKIHQGVFGSMWTVYDWVWKPVFGDGEKTVEKEDSRRGRRKDVEEQ